jgi:hypothetical protein
MMDRACVFLGLTMPTSESSDMESTNIETPTVTACPENQIMGVTIVDCDIVPEMVVTVVDHMVQEMVVTIVDHMRPEKVATIVDHDIVPEIVVTIVYHMVPEMVVTIVHHKQ